VLGSRDRADSIASQGSSAHSMGGLQNPETNLGIHLHTHDDVKPKRSLLSTRSLNIEELKKVHENLSISNYLEPTNEQGPYRPKMAGGLSREQLRRRIE